MGETGAQLWFGSYEKIEIRRIKKKQQLLND